MNNKGLAFIYAILITATPVHVSAANQLFPPPKDTPSLVRFAVIADLSGGERKGVFNVASEGIRQLQPDFIMSIGDLIEGGTEDEAQMNKEWQLFLQNLANQNIPFYPAVGNHDISNSKMRKWYEATIGPRYYHFVFKNTLFVVMDSEDFTDEFFVELKTKRNEAVEVYKQTPEKFPETEYAQMKQRYFGEISDKQRDYVLETLEQHQGVRWTFIFMHKPVWKNEDERNFKAIEAKLTGRNYTVFNGHVHTYEHTERFGHDYIQLATSGGEIFKGELNNMDHITWVGLSQDNPTYLNIKLDGMRDKKGMIPAQGDGLCFDKPECSK